MTFLVTICILTIFKIVNNTLSINLLIVELSATSLEKLRSKKALTKIKTKQDLNKEEEEFIPLWHCGIYL